MIEKTAGFVRKGGGQMEVLLRVKQAGNPLFAFLTPGDRLHPFFRWLVQAKPQVRRCLWTDIQGPMFVGLLYDPGTSNALVH